MPPSSIVPQTQTANPEQDGAASPLLVRACRGEQLARPPVWMMRQAGRYMPEYQAIRARADFLTACKTPDIAAEISLQPYHAFGMDAVIMFSDILMPPEAMGLEVVFGNGQAGSAGPHFTRAVRTEEDVKRLVIPDPVEKTGFVMNLLRQLREALKDSPETALIGFAGAPWTLAAYMVEGGGSRHFRHLRSMMWQAPDLLHSLLDKTAQTVILYLNAQIEAGAQVIQLFDTWAGILSEAEYRCFVLPYHQQILNALNRQHTPVILYVNHSRGLLPLMKEAGPDVVSVDAATTLSDARRILGRDMVLQGNLEPTALFLPQETLGPMVQQMLQEGGQTGYVFNLGHGILPETPVDTVRFVVDLVKQSARA